MGARRIPLVAASADRIDAIVPADTSHQVLVRRGLTYSRAVPVNVADAQPAIVLNTQVGGTQALAQLEREGEPAFTNTPTAPTRGNDRVTVTCTGFGAVTPVVEGGQVAPPRPGADAAILTIPPGTAAGDRVSVELESQGQ